MAVETTNSTISYTGNNSVTVFAYNFLTYSEDHLFIYLDDVVQSSGFAVTGVGDDTGGSVTFDVAPLNGVIVRIDRTVPVTQLIEYQEYGPFPAKTNERGLDLGIMIDQQNDREAERSFIEKMDKQPLATENNIVTFDDEGNSKDSGFNIGNIDGFTPIEQARQAGDNAETEFSTPADVSASPFEFQVRLNGLRMRGQTDYTTSTIGKINFNVAPANLAEIDITWYKPLLGIDAVSLINDLSQAYKFPTVAAYKDFTTSFPDGKQITLLDRGATFTKISGVGSANTFNIIANSTLSESIELPIDSETTLKQMGVDPTGSNDAMIAISVLSSVNNGIVNLGENKSDVFAIKSYSIITTDLTIKGKATLRLDNAQDFAIDCEGDLVVDGATLDSNNNAARSFFFCKNKQPKIKNAHFENSLSNAHSIIVNGTRTAGLQVLNQTGILELINITTDGSMDFFVEGFGYTTWAEPTAMDALAIIEDCPFISCRSFFYSLKGYNDAQVHRNLYKNALHVSIELFSQDTGLTGTWTESSAATVDGGRVTATAGSAYFRQAVTTVGKKYRLIFDALADGTMTIFDGSAASGVSIFSSQVVDKAYVIEYTATNSLVTFRFDSARLITFEKLRLIEENLQKTNATFDTYNYECTNNVFIGGERGPTAGIDTLTVKISDNVVKDAWIRAIAVDTERFDATSWDSIYPDSKATVNDNKLYDSGRALYSSCRNIKFIDNDIDQCGHVGSFTSISSALRFNSADFGSSQNARLFVDNNNFARMGSNKVLTVFNATVTLGKNFHDSTDSSPIEADSGSAGKFNFIDGNKFALETGDFDLGLDRNHYAIEYSATGTFAEISVPTKPTRSCIGKTYTVAFNGTVGDIRFKALSTFATVNGGVFLVVPVGTKIATLTCVTEDNDFIVGFS